MSEHLQAEDNNSISAKKGMRSSAGELRKLTSKISVAGISLFFLLGLFVGFKEESVLSFLGISVLILIPYFLLSFFAPKSRWIPFASSFTLSALSVLIFYQSDGNLLFFLLFFMVSGIALLSQEPKACFVPVVSSFLFYIVVSNLEQTFGTGVSNPDILYYNFFLLGFAGICYLGSRFLAKLTFKEESLVREVQEFKAKSETSIQYAREIATGNLNADYHPEEGDTLGQSLLEMSNNLRKAAEVERERTWQIEGIAKLHEILRQHNANVEDLSYQIILFLVKYLNANQGGVFIVNEDDEKEPFLELKACYAYSRKKHMEKKVEIGEGILGQAYVEKDMVYITDVPQDYFMIKSGLGDASPTSVILVPLKTEEKVVGVVEIASFHEMPAYVQEFLQKASESIASSITTMKVNEVTNRLLQESQEMAEEMRAQEEEMRQNMEELHATQEDLHRKNLEQQQAEEEIKESQVFLNEVLNSIPAPVFVKNRDHQVVLFNRAYQEQLQQAKSPALTASGNTPKDEFHQEDEQVFLSGESVKVERALKGKNGESQNYLISKAVLNNSKGEAFLLNFLADSSNSQELE